MINKELTWEPFSLEDSEVILGLMKSYYAYDRLDFNQANALNSLKTFLNRPELGQGWLIKFNSESIGYIIMTNGFSFEFNGFYQFIDEFFIVESMRSKGIGKSTLKFVEQAGLKNNIRSIHLEVEQDNLTAQKFYKLLNFQDHGRHLWSKSLIN